MGRVQAAPTSHTIIRLVRLNAVRRPGDIRAGPAREDPIIFGDQSRVAPRNLATPGAPAPDSHEKQGVEPVLCDAIPERRRHVGQRDVASLGTGQALEPGPGAYLEQVRVRLHSIADG